MLTAEQTAIRLRDNEIARLKTENEKLRSKLYKAKDALVAIAREAAKSLPTSKRIKVLEMADELEGMEI